MDETLLNRFGGDRISSRHIDELIGIARGLLADGRIDEYEVEFLRGWLASSLDASDQPMLRNLYNRVTAVLSDGVVDDDEKRDLFDTLTAFTGGRSEVGEMMKATNLPLDAPAPVLVFSGVNYCFTGTFVYGQRKACEQAILARGGSVGSINRNTHVLVIGAYATSSWLHSSFGAKILKATSLKAKGHPIAIVSESHWTEHL